MDLRRIDHVVFTVRDIDGTCDSYEQVLGMHAGRPQATDRSIPIFVTELAHHRCSDLSQANCQSQ